MVLGMLMWTGTCTETLLGTGKERTSYMAGAEVDECEWSEQDPSRHLHKANQKGHCALMGLGLCPTR